MTRPRGAGAADVALGTGVTLHCVRGGLEATADRATVVFVNGLTMDTTSWAGVEAGFAGSYPTLRYDCRGQGASDKPAGAYRPEQHAADLEALLDATGVGAVHLVGLSNGGLIAALLAGALAERRPGRVESLVLIDSFARVDAQLTLILRSWKAALAAGGAALRFDVATPWVWGHRFLEQHLEEVLAYREQAAAADPAAIGSLIDGLIGFGDARESLAAYPGPLLALVGADDVLTPVRYSREITAWARRGRLEVLDGAGHAAPIEHPEAVVRLVAEFLEGLSDDAG